MAEWRTPAEIRHEEVMENLQFSQTKILEKQIMFTKILALATVILGLVAFLSFFELKVDLKELLGAGIYMFVDVISITFGLAILFMAFILLIRETIKSFS